MRSSRTHPALLGLLLTGLLVAAGAPRAADPGPSGGGAVTEAAPDGDSGIGGTGRGDEDSGIGGTGIYGTITAFGSIWVNGLRIGYDPDAAVEINGRQADTGDLAVGQLVWVEAVTADQGLWTRRISVFSAALGRITELDPERRLLTVSGQRIQVPGEAILLDLSGRRLPDLSELARGDLVDVSGLRHPDGHIVATRIAETPGPAELAWEQIGIPELEELLAETPRVRSLSVEGFLHRRAESGELEIDGLAVDASALGELQEPDPGRRVWLSGDRAGDRVLRLHRITPRPLPPPAGPGSAQPGAPPDGSGRDRPRSAPTAGPPRLGASDLPQLIEAGEGGERSDAQGPARPPGKPERPEVPGAREPLHRPGLPDQLPVLEPPDQLVPLEPDLSPERTPLPPPAPPIRQTDPE